MTARIVIGVMGAGASARRSDCELAERLGELLASEGWVVLTGGRDVGIMAAALRGAKRVSDSMTVGVLPTDSGAAAEVDLPIFTGLGNARNVVNVLSSRVVITCGQITPGTASEAALAVKTGRPLILLAAGGVAIAFFTSLGGTVRVAQTAEAAVAEVRSILEEQAPRR